MLAHDIVGQRVDLAARCDLAFLDNAEVLGRRPREFHILLHKNDRQADLFVEPLDRVLDLLDDVGLNALRGLIEQQDAGLGRQCPCDRQLLLLTAR